MQVSSTIANLYLKHLSDYVAKTKQDNPGSVSETTE